MILGTENFVFTEALVYLTDADRREMFQGHTHKNSQQHRLYLIEEDDRDWCPHTH